MKIKLIAIGKTDEAYLKEGIEKYLNRLKHYIAVEILIIPDLKQGSKPNIEKTKADEGLLILQKIDNNDHLVLLDEGGKAYTSSDFSIYFQKKMNVLSGNLVFVIGGPFGFSNEVYARAQEKLSLSSMTFSHQMIRLFFVEQLYRAYTIIKGEKYHHS